MQCFYSIKISWAATAAKGKKNCVKRLIRETTVKKVEKHWYRLLSLPIILLFGIGWQRCKVHED